MDKVSEQAGETLTPDRVEAIQTAIHEDLGRFLNTTSYFMLGSYGEEERPRLKAVRDHLASDATASKFDTEVDAFLMDDILDVSEFDSHLSKRAVWREQAYPASEVGRFPTALGIKIL